jgi:2-polyprenyl-3-methyl-5-hydroxy-6-metoxy-1,4-benzoquinol methylase
MTIGAAYAKYYTHGKGESVFFVRSMKARLRNECLSQKLYANIEPRLHLSKLLNGVVALIGKRVSVPFGWTSLAGRPKGRFLDVGCGAGLTVALARHLGWDAMGLEIDPAAVREARRSGLNILEGTYAQLTQFEGQFDCIMCSHVLEHVHEPRDLLAKLKVAIKPGGVLLLTLPNALSSMRRHFGANWRGLEAPRHISIPSELRLSQLLSEAGFSIKSITGTGFETAAESYRIQRRGMVLSRHDFTKARQLDMRSLSATAGNDFIKFVCEAEVVAPT